MVEVRQLEVTYSGPQGPVRALAGVDFTLPDGESCAIIGPSGCGKTTLLSVLAGLVAPTAGRAMIRGQPVAARRPETALILQDYGLLPWKTVEHNAELGLLIRGVGAAERRRRVEEVLRELGLWEFRRHYPHQLSGGMRQRVAIARALTLGPDLLLMDEPFSSLDALTRESLQETLLDVWRRGGTTLVLVTHSIEEAALVGRTVLVLSERPGRVAHRLENPSAGRVEYRASPHYHRQCVRLRRLLADGAGRQAGPQRSRRAAGGGGAP